jgi:iron complex outermembrane receptor protein
MLGLWLCLPSALIAAEEPASSRPGQEPPIAESAPTPSPVPGPRGTLVVTPNRGRPTPLVDSPAAVTVIAAEDIAAAPDRTLGELLRAVPGVNAVRYSVRDYNVTSRQATTTLANSQLALLDGRSVYQDFVGAILWDLTPVDPGDIAQVEVVRGPASAVWGANAFTGVVNIVTRSPRDAPGSSLELGLVNFNRDAGSGVGLGSGLGYRGTTSLARALDETLSFRVSGGLFVASPLARPVGTLPITSHPLVPGQQVGGGTLPADIQGEPGNYRNRGTTQPWMDLRFDQELGREERISYAVGVSGTDGIIHTAIGPFNLERGSASGYLRTSYRRDKLNVTAYANLLRVKGPNLLAFDVNEDPLRLSASTQAYDLEMSDSRLLTGKQILTYGGTAKHGVFRVSLAPAGDNRTELGAFLQDELFLDWGDRRRQELRLALGARVDKFGNLEGLVFSPRLSILWKPGGDHGLRLSANKAFRAPSFINNYLDTTVLRPVDLGELFPTVPPEFAPALEEDYLLPQRVIGDPNLREESLTSYEVGYVGAIGRTTFGLNLYRNDTDDSINFYQFPDDYDPYTSANPPPDWPLPPSFLDALAAQDIHLSHTSNQFKNLGPIRQRGLEAFLQHRFLEGVTGWVNYSWQGDPRPLPAADPFPALEITMPPRQRINGGISWSSARTFGSLGLNHADRAFWVDVLPHDFDGYAEAYTLFNATIGARWARGAIVTTLRGTNLTNEEVHQNTFGDIVKRTIALDVRFRF